MAPAGHSRLHRPSLSTSGLSGSALCPLLVPLLASSVSTSWNLLFPYVCLALPLSAPGLAWEAHTFLGLTPTPELAPHGENCVQEEGPLGPHRAARLGVVSAGLLSWLHFLPLPLQPSFLAAG